MDNPFKKPVYEQLKDKDHDIERLKEIINYYEEYTTTEGVFCQECGTCFWSSMNTPCDFCSVNCILSYKLKHKQDAVKCRECSHFMTVIMFEEFNGNVKRTCDICDEFITDPRYSLGCIPEDDTWGCNYDVCHKCAKDKVKQIGLDAVKKRNMIK